MAANVSDVDKLEGADFFWESDLASAVETDWNLTEALRTVTSIRGTNAGHSFPFQENTSAVVEVLS
jgi:hypothetical protein